MQLSFMRGESATASSWLAFAQRQEMRKHPGSAESEREREPNLEPCMKLQITGQAASIPKQHPRL